MSNTSDGSGKGPPKPGETPPKKPSAIIDLKPTDVDIRDVKDERKEAATGTSSPPSATSASTAGSSAPGSIASKVTSIVVGGVQPASSASGKSEPPKPSDQPSRTTTGEKATASAASSTPARSAQPTASKSGFASHLLAGVCGGALAIWGASSLGLNSPAVTPGTATLSPDLGRRLQALETTAARSGQAAPADVAQKLSLAEARLARLEEIGRTVGEISQAQLRLASETKALGERVGQPLAGDGSADARLAKLEETLNTLSTAAVNDPQRGRIPQLAAITGRLADLESNLNTQIGALRKSVTAEVDSRLSQSSEASEAARTGTQRLDREIAGIKTKSSRLKSATDRIESDFKSIREETASLKTGIDTTRVELKQAARPADVATAMSPVIGRLAAVETSVQGVVKGEADRAANVERIVLALELGNLKRAIERGTGFTAELAEVRRVAGPRLNLKALESHQQKGVPTTTELSRELRDLAHPMIEADAEGPNASWSDRLMSGAKSIVRVRRTDGTGTDATAEAIVARMEAGLREGKLGDVAAEAKKLGARAQTTARGWLEKVEARATIERAILDIETELKSALGAKKG